jgi:hypothetical protein
VSEKRSKYVEAGSPVFCLLPSCNQPFLDRCTRGSDGHFYCSQGCADEGRTVNLKEVKISNDQKMNERSAQVKTICECIDHCFASAMWSEDFARHVDIEDMIMGLERAFDVVSDATRLHSLLALRKVDEFLRTAKSQRDDLIAADLGVDVAGVLGDAGNHFLSADERISINKGAAHLTERLTLAFDSDAVDLEAIIDRSFPVFGRLVAALRKADAKKEASRWLEKTESLLELAHKQAQETKRVAAEASRSNP